MHRPFFTLLLLFSPPLLAGGTERIETWFSHDVSYAVFEGGFLIRPGEAVAAVEPGENLERLDLGPLPDRVNVSAVHRERNSGHILFALDTATALPGFPLTVRPNDVIRWSGTNYSLRFRGQDALNADLNGAAIDAITEDAAGRLALSFDIDIGPGGMVIGGNGPGPGTLRKAGLYAIEGNAFDPVPVFDPAVAGVPAGANLNAAHYSTAPPFSGLLLLTFDTALVAGAVPVRNHEVALAASGDLLGLAVVPGLNGDPGTVWGNDIRLNALFYGTVGTTPGAENIFSDRFEIGPQIPK